MSCFACEIAEGLLACVKADAIENLSKTSEYVWVQGEIHVSFAYKWVFGAVCGGWEVPWCCIPLAKTVSSDKISSHLASNRRQVTTADSTKPQGESEKSSKLSRSSKVQFSTAGVIKPTHARIFPEEASTMMELLIPGVSV